MSKIYKGDVVVVHKPLDVLEHPTWVPKMDRYDGKKFVVSSIFESNNTALLSGTGLFYFNINWLEQVTTDDDFDTEIGGLYE